MLFKIPTLRDPKLDFSRKFETEKQYFEQKIIKFIKNSYIRYKIINNLYIIHIYVQLILI